MKILSVVESVLEHLRGQIITGALQSGQRMNEIQLADQLKVSRPPLREAFRVLEQERLIINIPRKGRFVTKLSLNNLEMINRARLMIENEALDVLAQKEIRLLPKVNLAMEKSISQEAQYTEPNEKLRFLKNTDRFHVELVKAAGNDLLIHFYKTIKYNISRYKYLFVFVPGRPRALLDEHRSILTALTNGDYPEAKRCLGNHLSQAYDRMIDHFQEHEAELVDREKIYG